MKQALIASLNHILNASFLKPSGHIETLLHMPANKKKDQCPSVQCICSLKSLIQDADTASPLSLTELVYTLASKSRAVFV